MGSEITTILTVCGSVITAALTYAFTKNRDRETEWQNEKRRQYKELVLSISGIIRGESSPEQQKEFARACNNMNLIAPQKVIEALQAFQDETKISNSKKDDKKHDFLLSKLFYEMRKDLKISPKDNTDSFSVRLWASGSPCNIDSLTHQ